MIKGEDYQFNLTYKVIMKNQSFGTPKEKKS